MKRIAFYGGSFDPPHRGHLAIARKLAEQFRLDEFFFVPAFHAPHKKRKKPTSAFHRFAMLALETEHDAHIKLSTIELDAPEKPYTVETQTKLLAEYGKRIKIFFVIGADSWQDITTWRDWEKVLTLTNIIVVTRPGYEVSFEHITREIRERIVDLRKTENKSEIQNPKSKIYISDAVQIDISATDIRNKIREKQSAWREQVPPEVANYIEKYNLYI